MTWVTLFLGLVSVVLGFLLINAITDKNYWIMESDRRYDDLKEARESREYYKDALVCVEKYAKELSTATQNILTPKDVE